MAQTLIEGYLMQDALDEIDSYCPREKQFMMLSMMLDFYRGAKERLRRGEELKAILQSEFLDFMGKMRFIPTSDMEKIRKTWLRIQEDWIPA